MMHDQEVKFANDYAEDDATYAESYERFEGMRELVRNDVLVRVAEGSEKVRGQISISWVRTNKANLKGRERFDSIASRISVEGE